MERYDYTAAREAVAKNNALRDIIHTAQQYETEGVVMGVTLDLLRKILAGQATHADVTSTDQLMRIRLAKKEGA
jgi:hypothetical protein